MNDNIYNAGASSPMLVGPRALRFEHPAQPRSNAHNLAARLRFAQSPNRAALRSARTTLARRVISTSGRATISMLLTFVAMVCLVGCQTVEELYQRDADIVRARHLVEWAQIVETYHAKAGRYPLQNRVKGDEILLVQIATREQQAYLDPRDRRYRREIDNNLGKYTPVSVKDFVAEIEGVVGRDIEERYDPQRVPTGAPIYLSYFATRNGYLIWTVCRTCPPHSNSFSTLLWTGTPSVNIGSDWFIKNVRKTQSIASLQTNEEFVAFVGHGPTRTGWFEALERAQAHESKK